MTDIHIVYGVNGVYCPRLNGTFTEISECKACWYHNHTEDGLPTISCVWNKQSNSGDDKHE